MTVDEILELMDDMLDKAVAVPFSNKKSLVEIDKMRDYIDEIRFNLPNEITNAKKMVGDRSEIIKQANQEAEGIIKRAEERAKVILDHDQIVKQAKEKANDIILTAQNKDREIRIAMNERIDEMLSATETMLSKNISDVRQVKSAIKSTKKK